MSWKASLSSVVQEIRFHVCQKSDKSAGMRSYIKSNYPILKSLNPELSILIRESINCEPKVIVRGDYGVEKSINVSELNENDINKSFELLIKEAKLLPKSTESNTRQYVDII